MSVTAFRIFRLPTVIASRIPPPPPPSGAASRHWQLSRSGRRTPDCSGGSVGFGLRRFFGAGFFLVMRSVKRRGGLLDARPTAPNR